MNIYFRIFVLYLTDYVAFTLGAERLNEEDRKSTPIDVSEFDFVIEFETCNSTTELLSGTLYLARVRYNPYEIDEYVDEFLDIQKFYSSCIIPCVLMKKFEYIK